MTVKQVDALLIGAGIMSTTLATLLKQIQPSLNLAIVEQLEAVALESSDALNNAGTGHAAYCELNYTPQKPDGSLDITKALRINESFELTQQFWSYLAEQGILQPETFIHQVPHCSFVWGEENCAFLRQRHETLKQTSLFADMEFTDDPAVIRQWMPLVMQNRASNEPVAATRVPYGSDVNFGALTRNLMDSLQQQDGFQLHLNHRVENLDKQADGQWKVTIKDLKTGQKYLYQSRFVFIGAGGAALQLLQKSGIEEGKGYGGFPVSGQWLICNNPEIVEKHQAKVYGKAPLGAPPMSVPHLDTRIIAGKKTLLFGPFAGFTTRFLKRGSLTDLPFSIRPHNLVPLMSVGMHNMDLTRYLIGESLQSHESRVKALRKFIPDVRAEDWQLSIAGQRVQVIKRDEKGGGKLEFGTETIISRDKTLAALLGASPGASTAVQAMLGILEQAFAELLNSDASKEKMRQMLPSYGRSLADNPELLAEIRSRNLKTLKLAE